MTFEWQTWMIPFAIIIIAFIGGPIAILWAYMMHWFAEWILKRFPLYK